MRLIACAIAWSAAIAAPGYVFSGTEVAKSLDGSWQCTYFLKFPGPSPDDVVKKIRMKFAGTKATFEDGDKTLQFSMKADFTKKPAEIDLTAEDGPAKGQMLLGLFVLKNDELTIQFGNSPTERSKWNQSGGVLMEMVFKRIK